MKIDQLCNKLQMYANFSSDDSCGRDTEYWHYLVLIYRDFEKEMNGSFRRSLADEIEKQCAFIDEHYEVEQETVEFIEKRLKYKP